MQQDKQPDYHPVVFRDRSAGYAFLTRSTATSDRTIEWDDGETYPVVDVEISSESHPFYTGKARTVDSEDVWPPSSGATEAGPVRGADGRIRRPGLR